MFHFESDISEFSRLEKKNTFQIQSARGKLPHRQCSIFHLELNICLVIKIKGNNLNLNLN